VERIGNGADCAARSGPADAWCAKSGRAACEQRGNVDDAWHSDACASAEYVAATISSDAGSRGYVTATVSSDSRSSEHFSAAVNGNSHNPACVARRRDDGESAGLLAETRHREIGMRAARYLARRLAGGCDDDSATEATAVSDSFSGYFRSAPIQASRSKLSAMNRLICALLMAAALCAGCTMPSGPTPAGHSGPTTAGPRLPGRPTYCLSYPDPGTCSTARCDGEFAQICPEECTDPDGPGGAPPSCSPSMSCQAAKTAAYHNCIGRCASIPSECR
jgi:hypothetical protein